MEQEGAPGVRSHEEVLRAEQKGEEDRGPRERRERGGHLCVRVGLELLPLT